MDIQIFADSSFQFFDAAKDTATNALVGDLSEPSLHLVDPGAICRREVDMKARPFREPLPDDVGLMRAVVVQDDVNIEICRYTGFDRIQKPAELPRTMSTMSLSDHPAGFPVECGE